MRVLITYFARGMGHKSPAMAIANAIMANRADCEIHIMDCGAELDIPSVEKSLKRAWDISLSHPKIFRPVFHLTDRPAITRFFLDRHARKLAPHFAEYAKKKKPDICISTHFTSAAGMVMAGMQVSLITTEPFGAHAFWIVPGVKEYIVPSKEVKVRLHNMGVKEPILVFDYPMRTLRKQSARSEIRKRLGIKGLCILMTGGGEGISNSEKMLKALIARQYRLTVIVACGKNRGLYSRMKKINGHKTTLIVKGYVNNMEELIVASDLVVGKTGANTVLEALQLKRPFCCTHVMENERELKDYVVGHGLGWYVRNPGVFAILIGQILSDRSILNRVNEALKKTRIRSGAADIATHLLRDA